MFINNNLFDFGGKVIGLFYIADDLAFLILNSVSF